jgi:cation-transporting P-type ATPase E
MNTTFPGLTTEEVSQRIALGQVNRTRRSDAVEYMQIVARNVLTLFNALVVPAAVSLFLLREYRGAFAVSGMALTNTLLGLIQEIRAKWHLEHLALLTESKVRVVRDGAGLDVPSGDVVQDDVLLLAAGETVVADGTLLDAQFLEIDEALLTGESDPVPRKPGEQILSGSFCVAGEGAYRADAVGAASFAQKTSSEASSYHYSSSPLQRSINRLIQILTAVAVVLCGLYVVLYFVQGFPLSDLVQMIAATITSMVPVGLMLMTTLAFILGALRMSQRGALVQRLNAVESMASIDTLCMDKTGTLTTNHLQLERVVILAEELSEIEIQERLRLFVSGSLDAGNKSLAAVRAALGETRTEQIDQIPFQSRNRYSAVHVRSGNRSCRLALGAFEALESLIPQNQRTVAEDVWRQLMPTGSRLLLFAEVLGQEEQPFNGSLEGFVLRPLAFLALRDELRPEARGVLQMLASQGIAFKILSGDNPDTVQATIAPLADDNAAPALLALADQPVVTGAALEAAGAEAGEWIRKRCVFGRVSPWQKVQIVTTLKEQGRYVAMVGDGVNDVLPIKNAHLGIAMGDGSRASKTVAGLVLETNDFQLLPETLEEGRTIIRNLRRAGKLFLTKNVYMLIVIVGALGVFQLPFPLVPQQITLLNALTIGIPALLITLSKERSAGATRKGFVREVGGFAVRTGVILGAAGLVLMLASARIWEQQPTSNIVSAFGQAGGLPDPWQPGFTAETMLKVQYAVNTQRTLLLSGLILLGLVSLLRLVTDGESQALRGDRWFLWLALAAIPIYLVAMYWPLAAWYFELTPLNLKQWALVLVVVVPATGLALWSDQWR